MWGEREGWGEEKSKGEEAELKMGRLGEAKPGEEERCWCGQERARGIQRKVQG